MPVVWVGDSILICKGILRPPFPVGLNPFLCKQQVSVCAPLLVGKPLSAVPLGSHVGFACMLPMPRTWLLNPGYGPSFWGPRLVWIWHPGAVSTERWGSYKRGGHLFGYLGCVYVAFSTLNWPQVSHTHPIPPPMLTVEQDFNFFSFHFHTTHVLNPFQDHISKHEKLFWVFPHFEFFRKQKTLKCKLH